MLNLGGEVAGDGYYSNYNDVLDQLSSHGLLIHHLEIDTPKPRRCGAEGYGREKRGWYWLSSFSVNGDNLIIGAYGIYQGADNGKQTIKLPTALRDKLSPEQIQAQKARHKEAKKRAETERKKESAKASELAARAWKTFQTDGISEYLQRKQVQAFGVRFTNNGSLAIPMVDETGSIKGLQFILPKGHDRIAKVGRDKEFWPKGLQMQGTYHLIGDTPKKILLIAEGYATGASLHQATGLPVAIVWTANNILHACQTLKKRHPRSIQLICADDDRIQKCAECGKNTTVNTETCQHCGQNHRKNNAGITNAQAAAVAINGAWTKPNFQQPLTDTKGPTDYNDLHILEGLDTVSQQIQAKLAELGLDDNHLASASTHPGGEGKTQTLKSMLTIDEAVERFALVFGGKGTMFDGQEHILVPKADVLDILPEHGWRDMRAIKKVVRLDEVGFDPSGTDHKIKCNLWGGWPTTPATGKCDNLLDLLYYLCSNEEKSSEVYDWVIKWLAYPIQNPGAKMKTSLIFHGPQGTGKNLFFESVMAIYGEYGRIVDQSAIEDKFNDWASKKLFLIADEVVARTELFHIKNKLKCFVTGEWIRINPKNVAAHDERNHVNLVFLSNESQPLVLEKDDRRYMVIHTPVKLPENFYQQISDEIKAGGIQALHHHLLNLDLQEFSTHSKPPMTRAKSDLIEVSMDSVNSFIRDWSQGEIKDIPFCPCLGTQLHNVYRKYCDRDGDKYPRQYRQFIGAIKMMDGWTAGQPATTLDSLLPGAARISRKMVIPPDHLLTDHKNNEQTKEQWLTESYYTFAKAAGYAE